MATISRLSTGGKASRKPRVEAPPADAKRGKGGKVAVRASNSSSVSNFIGNHALTIGGGAVAGAIATYYLSQHPTEHTEDVDEDGDGDDEDGNDDEENDNEEEDDNDEDDELTESELQTIQTAHPNIYHKIVQARTRQTAREDRGTGAAIKKPAAKA